MSQNPVLPFFSMHRLPPGSRLGLAVSGGADSIALARIAHRLAERQGWMLHMLHMHHGLRGDAARADAAFVEAFAKELGLTCEVLHADANALARDRQMGIEEAGRLLRYGWFQRLLLGGQLDAVATGHTLDDQAETVLAKLLRGSWTAGLAGIYPHVAAVDLPSVNVSLPNPPLAYAGEAATPAYGRTGFVVRPLLGTRRADLRTWLTAIGQSWREDASNQDLQFTRNRIRHQLLPVLTEFNPQVAEQLTQVSILARDEEHYWQAEVDRLLPSLLLPGRPVRGGGRASSTLPGERSLAMEVERLRALPVALTRRILRGSAVQLGVRIAFAETERALQLLDGPTGSTARREQLTAELRVERSPRELRFVFSPSQTVKPMKKMPAIPIAIPGEATGFGVRVQIQLAHPGEPATAANSRISDAPTPLVILRPAQPADRVRLRYSSGAPKRIKEVLERLGVPAEDRQGWPVLEWQGELVWLRGAVLEPTPLSSQLTIIASSLSSAAGQDIF